MLRVYRWKSSLHVFGLKVDSVNPNAQISQTYLAICTNWRSVFSCFRQTRIAFIHSWPALRYWFLLFPQGLNVKQYHIYFLVPFTSSGAHYTVTSNRKFKRSSLSVTLNLLCGILSPQCFPESLCVHLLQRDRWCDPQRLTNPRIPPLIASTV